MLEFVVGVVVGGVVQAFAAGLIEALNSNKVYHCEGPGCQETMTPRKWVRTKTRGSRWHNFHDSDCAIAYSRNVDQVRGTSDD